MSKCPPIFVEKVSPEAKLPERSFPSDSGMDVFAYSFGHIHEAIVKSNPGFAVTSCVLRSSGRVLVNTGLMATVGHGYEIQVRPRSGLALKSGITVLNSPGTVDESYRGAIGVILVNNSKEDFVINVGDKIAQLVVCPVTLSEIIEVNNLPITDRGSGGFGSTGTK